MSTPKVYSPEEARAILRVGRTVMYRWLREGRIKSYRNGRLYLIPATALKAFIETEIAAHTGKDSE